MRNDRMAIDREIRRVLANPNKNKVGGPILYYSHGQSYVYANEGHLAIIGSSGCGKSYYGTMGMIRSFIEGMESFIVVDPKAEIYRNTGCYAEASKYDIHVIDFRHIADNTNEHWNPLATIVELYTSKDPVKIQAALELLDHLAIALFPDKGPDPYWNKAARNLFRGVVYALMEFASPEQVTMEGVYRFITDGHQKYNGFNNTYLKEFVTDLVPDSIPSMMLKSYVTTAEDTAAGIRSTCLDSLDIFARSKALVNMLSTDDLHINDLDGETPTAIYIILPDESPCFDELCGILCTELTTHYIRLAQDKYPDKKLPRRLNICLEELGNIGNAISNLPHLMSAARSRNIRLQIVLQSITQLNDLYGASAATTILANCDVTMAFRSNNWDTLNELSSKCGQRYVDTGYSYALEPLITPSQLAAMETGQALIIISGRTKYVAWLPNYDTAYNNEDWKLPSPPKYEHKEHMEVFDIAYYVTEKKRKLREETQQKQNSELTDCLPPLSKYYEAIEEIIFSDDKLEKALKPYSLVITSVPTRNIARMIFILSSQAEISPDEARDALKKLPSTLSFETEKKAEKVKTALEEMGVIVELRRNE